MFHVKPTGRRAAIDSMTAANESYALVLELQFQRMVADARAEDRRRRDFWAAVGYVLGGLVMMWANRRRR
jgi:hypothetical protein